MEGQASRRLDVIPETVGCRARARAHSASYRAMAPLPPQINGDQQNERNVQHPGAEERAHPELCARVAGARRPSRRSSSDSPRRSPTSRPIVGGQEIRGRTTVRVTRAAPPQAAPGQRAPGRREDRHVRRSPPPSGPGATGPTPASRIAPPSCSRPRTCWPGPVAPRSTRRPCWARARRRSRPRSTAPARSSTSGASTRHSPSRSTGAADSGRRGLEPDGLSAAGGVRLRHHAVQLHRHRRQPAHRARAHGQHGGLEARARRRRSATTWS